MTDSNPIRVQCRDLSIGYRYDRPVLKGLDLDVVPGDVLAIIGPNGSGKTTLMLTLMGVLEPLGGEVSIAGLPPSEYRRRNGFGYLRRRHPDARRLALRRDSRASRRPLPDRVPMSRTP